jgi:hypothetical protein
MQDPSLLPEHFSVHGANVIRICTVYKLSNVTYMKTDLAGKSTRLMIFLGVIELKTGKEKNTTSIGF